MMIEFQEYDKCEKCTHENVCKYKEERPDAVSKLAHCIDNLVDGDVFEINFHCKSFKVKSLEAQGGIK